jgi:hypothetical protein
MLRQIDSLRKKDLITYFVSVAATVDKCNRGS